MIDNVKREIMMVNETCSLSHQITLGTTNAKKQRISEFTSREYMSNKYSNHSSLETLTVRGRDYYILSIKEPYVDTDGVRRSIDESIYISYPHLAKVKIFLNKILRWLESDEFSDLFLRHEEAIIINEKYEDLYEGLDGFPSDKYITANPVVYIYEDVYYEAVKLSINDKVSTVLTYDELVSLIYVYNSLNLYSDSLSLLNLTSSHKLLNSAGLSNSNNSYNRAEENRNKISEISSRRRRIVTD